MTLNFKRPRTAIDRAKIDATNRRSDSNNGTNLPRQILVELSQVIINENNIRNTFRSLEELNDYFQSYKFPVDAFDGDVELLDWIQVNINDDDPQKLAFAKVISVALSIKANGQLQPAGGVLEDGKYRIIYGSTRAMACYLLNRSLSIQVLEPTDRSTELKQHLFENIRRDDLTFTETTKGYIWLFNMLMDSGAIDDISRKTIMNELGISRTWAGKWNRVIKLCNEDPDYRSLVLSGNITSLNEAYQRIPLALTEGAHHGVSLHERDGAHPPSIELDASTLAKRSEKLGDVCNVKEVNPTLSTNDLEVKARCRIITHAMLAELARFESVDHPDLCVIRDFMNQSLPLQSVRDAGRCFGWLIKFLEERWDSLPHEDLGSVTNDRS